MTDSAPRHRLREPSADGRATAGSRGDGPGGGHGHGGHGHGGHGHGGHGHGGHGHGGLDGVAARRVRMLLAALLVACALAVLAGVLLLAPSPGEYAEVLDRGRAAGSAGGQGTSGLSGQQPVDGEVLRAAAGVDCSDPTAAATPGSECVALGVRLDGGPAAGTVIDTVVPAGAGAPRFAVGDGVVLSYGGGDDPSAAADPSSYQVVDLQRGTPLAVLGIVFAAAVIALGRWQGLRALVALGLTLGVLAVFVLPAIAVGSPPVAVALVAAGLVVGIVLPLTHGWSARTATAALGTLASLALIGVLAVVFAGTTRLTGVGEQPGELAAVLGPGLDLRGLLLAGVVIGALGVLDDVTVTQTSAVWELHRANPAAGLRDLYGSAMRVGRDHVASAVNTLVLAYAGAALPLLLLFALADRGLSDVLGAEDVAQEVLRTLVGSIGLVASVPVTTLLAAVVVRAVTRSVPPDPARPTSSRGLPA